MANSCCWACRGPLGICLNHKCAHHIEAEKQEDANDRARQTVRRPTEDQAINNIMRAERRKPKKEYR